MPPPPPPGSVLFRAHPRAHVSPTLATTAAPPAGFYAAVRKFVVIIIIAAPLFSFNAWVEVRGR